MKAILRWGGALAVFLAVVSVAHIQLTHKGFGTFLLRMRQGGVPLRGDLVVGFLPVT
ncbi:MAG: hypothetical protein IT186_11975 [Acidobacteria bacterium]|nr:hypothetical protein [Acidobacteriota bacterium]MCK6684984.1 hypothetical protein [Thermoanaerobaculia bacterium]